MVATVRQPRRFFTQTRMTLLYAARATKIETRAVVNTDVRGDATRELGRRVAMVASLRTRLRARDGELARVDRLLMPAGKKYGDAKYLGVV